MINFQTAIKQLIPCVCMVCDRASSELICDTCYAQMACVGLACYQCGERLPAPLEEHSRPKVKRCGRCISRPPPFSHTLFAFEYTGAAAQLIQSFKFNEALILSQFFAESIADKMLANQPLCPLPDVLLPIPLHTQRLKRRSFNQSYELARCIGLRLNIPVYKQLIRRRRATALQTSLRRQDRENNLKDAFSLTSAAAKRLKGKRVALVDDVITTGATMREVAKTLTRAKPDEITVIAIAKTQPNHF